MNKLTLDLECGHSMTFELPEKFNSLDEMEERKQVTLMLCANHLFHCVMEQVILGVRTN